MKQVAKMKFLLIIFILLTLSALMVINNYDIHLTKSQDFNEFSTIYGKWFENIQLNIKTITGNAVNLKWFPE